MLNNKKWTSGLTCTLAIISAFAVSASSLEADTEADTKPEGKADKTFKGQLAEQCLILKDDRLEKFKGDFAEAKIFAVYYSHTYCGSCKPYTKFLNEWYKKEVSKFPGVQLVFATRGDRSRKMLTNYVKKYEIKYPVLDEKYHVEADITGVEATHAFYSDADMGVPRIRYYNEKGEEISIKKHVKSVYSPDETIMEISKLIPKIHKK